MKCPAIMDASFRRSWMLIGRRASIHAGLRSANNARAVLNSITTVLTPPPLGGFAPAGSSGPPGLRPRLTALPPGIPRRLRLPYEPRKRGMKDPAGHARPRCQRPREAAFGGLRGSPRYGGSKPSGPAATAESDSPLDCRTCANCLWHRSSTQPYGIQLKRNRVGLELRTGITEREREPWQLDRELAKG